MVDIKILIFSNSDCCRLPKNSIASSSVKSSYTVVSSETLCIDLETIFKVKVSKVNTSILRGKGKTFKGQYGFRKDIKKAIVTLDEGNTIDSSLEIK